MYGCDSIFPNGEKPPLVGVRKYFGKKCEVLLHFVSIYGLLIALIRCCFESSLSLVKGLCDV